MFLKERYSSVSDLTGRLHRSGEKAVATVIANRTDAEGDEYFVTIQFATRAHQLITKEGRVSHASFAELHVGTRATVWYLPENPNVCLLETSMQHPLVTLSVVVGWWIVSLLVLGGLTYNLLLQRTFAKHGTIIDGLLLDAKVSVGGEDPNQVEVTYKFETPSGRVVRGTAKGNLSSSNLSELKRLGFSSQLQSEFHDASVTVLYLTEDRHLLL
jgi:uncharacterized protein DUF3592